MANNYNIRSNNGVQIESPIFEIINSGSTLLQISSSNIIISSSLNINGSITGSLFGTASQAISASRTITASYVNGNIFTGTNPVLTASYALSSSGGGGDTTAIEAQFWFLL